MNKTNRLFIDTRSGPYPGAVRLNCIGSPEREFGYYAEAFHEAGQTLIRGLRHDRGSTKVTAPFCSAAILAAVLKGDEEGFLTSLRSVRNDR